MQGVLYKQLHSWRDLVHQKQQRKERNQLLHRSYQSEKPSSFQYDDLDQRKIEKERGKKGSMSRSNDILGVGVIVWVTSVQVVDDIQIQ